MNNTTIINNRHAVKTVRNNEQTVNVRRNNHVAIDNGHTVTAVMTNTAIMNLI